MHNGLPDAGPIRTSLPWCFGSARPVFERSFTGSAGRCEISFQAVQKATFGTMGCRPRARSVLHCHGVLALRDRSLSEALLAVLEGVRLVSLGSSESDVWHLLHCHGVLALRDRSVSEALLAVLEGVRLVSRQFRKRRLALWAAGRGPDPHFTAMVFWPCETGL